MILEEKNIEMDQWKEVGDRLGIVNKYVYMYMNKCISNIWVLITYEDGVVSTNILVQV